MTEKEKISKEGENAEGEKGLTGLSETAICTGARFMCSLVSSIGLCTEQQRQISCYMNSSTCNSFRIIPRDSGLSKLSRNAGRRALFLARFRMTGNLMYRSQLDEICRSAHSKLCAAFAIAESRSGQGNRRGGRRTSRCNVSVCRRRSLAF